MIRVILAEDEAIPAIELKMGLKALGYDVIKVVDGGRELIRQTFNLNPDVIVTDIRLKDNISGIQAVKKILERIHIPIVVFSGNVDANRAVRKLNNNCAFLSKPTSADKISAEIINCMAPSI